jgi:hypothetical protein
VQQIAPLRRSGYVVCRPSAAFAAEGYVRVRRRWNLTGITLDGSGAGRTAEGRSAAIVANEKQCLSRVVRIRTWLAHELSNYFIRRCAAGVA